MAHMSTVLIIDGDTAVVQTLKDALSGQGVQTVVTGDGTEGLNLAKSTAPDVIVLCVELSRVSGYSVCNKLKKDVALASTPLILTSSQATEETFEQHKKLRTRAEAYLKKPFAVQEMMSLIGGYLAPRADVGGWDEEAGLTVGDDLDEEVDMAAVSEEVSVSTDSEIFVEEDEDMLLDDAEDLMNVEQPLGMSPSGVSASVDEELDALMSDADLDEDLGGDEVVPEAGPYAPDDDAMDAFLEMDDAATPDLTAGSPADVPVVDVAVDALSPDLDGLLNGAGDPLAEGAAADDVDLDAEFSSTGEISPGGEASAEIEAPAEEPAVAAPSTANSQVAGAEASMNEAQLESMRQLRHKVQFLENQIQEKELEFNDRLLQESTRARDAVEVKKRLAQVEREIAKYQEATQKAQAEAQDAKVQMTQLQQTLTEAANEKQALSDKLGQVVDKVKALAGEREALQKEIQGLRNTQSESGQQTEKMLQIRQKAKKAVDIALQLIEETGLSRQ